MSKTPRRPSSAARGVTDLLVADCGGTNVRFAIARPGADNAVTLSATRKLANDDFGSLDDALAAYLEDLPTRPAAAAIAFAGAVSHGVGALTNRPSWRIDGVALTRRFGFQDVLVVNDFAA